ncbi:MAG: GldG family protein [bacterium]
MKKHWKEFFTPLGVLLLVVNLILLNLILNRLFTRIDLSETKMFTLSSVTKEILRNLPETLTIKAYFTKNLPTPYNNISRYVEDQLAEIRAYSRGKLQYQLLDPADEEKLKQEAEKFRLEPIQVNEFRADRMEFKLAYLGMVLIYQDKQEVIPVISSLENLEYEIVSKIRRLTSGKIPTIGFLEGHGEKALRQDLLSLDRELRKLYTLKPVSLSLRNNIPEDIDLLCIIGPNQDIPEKDRFAIDQFLMRGGKLFILANGVKADIQNMWAERSALKWGNWLENYGFRINDDLILDARCPTLPFQMVTQWGRQITFVPYPLFPEIVNFNRDNSALKMIRQVRLYFPSSIDTTPVAEKEDLTLSVLMRTSDKTTRQVYPYNINPLTLGKLSWDESGVPVGVVIQGKFKSYWVNREVPKDTTGEPVTTEAVIPESPPTRIVAIGDANFITDNFLVPGQDNLICFLNLIDWMAQDERLLEIRSRQVTSRPLKEVSDGTRRTIKYASMFVPPILMVLFGLLRWKLRKANKITKIQLILNQPKKERQI